MRYKLDTVARASLLQLFVAVTGRTTDFSSYDQTALTMTSAYSERLQNLIVAFATGDGEHQRKTPPVP